MNWKIGQILAKIWISFKMYGNNKNGTWKEEFGEKNEWIEAIREAYNQISEDTIFNLVESVQKRMIKCYENIVDKVLY